MANELLKGRKSEYILEFKKNTTLFRDQPMTLT